MTTQKVGFIGLGAMGGLMASHLLSKGLELHVFDVQDALVQEFAEKGATTHPHPKSVAEHADIIVCMLPNPHIVRQVVLGENGVFEGVQKDAIVIDMGTCGPSIDIECSEQLATKGAFMMDAPVGKGTWAAGKGELTILAGGDPEVVERAKSVLGLLGNQIIYCGSLGSGQVVKLSNNLASCVNMATLSEVYVMALTKGIQVDILQEALTGTGADSWHLQNSLPRVKEENFEHGFKTRLAHKDLGLIVDLGNEIGIDLPVTRQAMEWYQNAMDLGYGELDWSVVAKAALEKSQQ